MGTLYMSTLIALKCLPIKKIQSIDFCNKKVTLLVPIEFRRDLTF